MFEKVTGEKLAGEGLFAPPPRHIPHYLNRVKGYQPGLQMQKENHHGCFNGKTIG